AIDFPFQRQGVGAIGNGVLEEQPCPGPLQGPVFGRRRHVADGGRRGEDLTHRTVRRPRLLRQPRRGGQQQHAGAYNLKYCSHGTIPLHSRDVLSAENEGMQTSFAKSVMDKSSAGVKGPMPSFVTDMTREVFRIWRDLAWLPEW